MTLLKQNIKYIIIKTMYFIFFSLYFGCHFKIYGDWILNKLITIIQFNFKVISCLKTTKLKLYPNI